LTKKCGTCKKIKASNEFNKHSCRSDGLSSRCKACISIAGKKHRESDSYKSKSLISNSRYRTSEKGRLRRLLYERTPTSKEQKRVYRKKRNQLDSLYKLTQNLRSLTRIGLTSRGYKKTSKTAMILGADFKTIQLHLLETCYNNYGLGIFDTEIKWHIDHIIPLAAAKNEEDLLKLLHYTNLQYLTAEDNMTKGARLDWSISDDTK
jgi:hypothetical protein